MSDQFIGEIRSFGFNFAPQGWAQCAGQLLSISQNTALFSLLGTTYGGNGTTTFGLPDLRGRNAVGAGQGPGIPQVLLGEQLGTETTTLTTQQIPAHSHTAEVAANGGATLATAPTASTSWFSEYQDLNNKGFLNMFAPNPPAPAKPVTMAGASIGVAGSGQPHENRQPFLAIGYCIAMQGIFPPRS